MTNRQVALILAVVMRHLSKYSVAGDIYDWADQLYRWLETGRSP